MSGQGDSPSAVLARLASGRAEPLASLADALMPAAEQPAVSVDSVLFDPAREIIAGLVSGSLTTGASPARIAEALVLIDRELSASDAVSEPFAVRLAPLVTECAVHATRERIADRTARELAEAAPLFYDRNRLFAAPVGPLGTDGMTLFADRVLAAVLTRRPKAVVLVLPEVCRGAGAAVIDGLCRDLEAQRVTIEKRILEK